MRDDEPLVGWLEFGLSDLYTENVAEFQARMRAGLDRIEDWLDHPPEGKRRNMVDLAMLSWDGFVGFAPEDVLRAQELYRRVFETGGPGNTYVQEDLLELLAGAEDVRSVPFWIELMDLRGPRDRFATRRRTLALAALARLAVRRDLPAAYAALLQLAHHAQPEVRASAIYYLALVYLFLERPLPADVAGELTSIATEDPAFLPRYQARAALIDAEAPVPMDNPGGIYEFKVTLAWAKDFHCVIACRAEDSLDNLHGAIQRAFDWDADHLYAFYMNGQRFDERYAFASPYDQDGPPSASEAILGELGLRLKDRFLYFFDYGDSHEFTVEVVGIRAQAEPGDYPRVIASSGTPPDQYPNWDDEEDE